MASEGAGFLGLVIGAQSLNVIGDAFGQRCSRKHFNFSKRHMVIALSILSSLQVLGILLILQLAAPESITGTVYLENSKLTCYEEMDIHNDFSRNCTASTCHVIPCPSQGPLTTFQRVFKNPILLLNGVANIMYYVAQVMLYREPLGMVFSVIAGVVSSFLIIPLQKLMDVPVSSPFPLSVFFLGLFGAIFIVLEKSFVDESESKNKSEGEEDDDAEQQPLLLKSKEPKVINDTSAAPNKSAFFGSTIRIAIPFCMIMISYSLYFVIQVFVSDKFRLNVWGFTTMDQGMLPLYTIPFLFLVHQIPFLRRIFDSPGDSNESFSQAMKMSWKELNFRDLFLHRLIINARAVAYFYLAVLFDLNRAYFQLNLIRCVLAWGGALILCLLIPKFIVMKPHEKKSILFKPHVFFKMIGTILIIISLIILKLKSKKE